ncbi:hypothetical protein [Spirochaeta lutea]|uniref:Uncharacterized protein n=1 Tax=Spirochaeta lutea TaxID=1480694 RepID=A0A098QTG0_9SPIO|nr:hypothetical protein [Spirochaeta lutea]KGE71014.1 hypothetical protein DC28_13915 [Spirochaeta lutea]
MSRFSFLLILFIVVPVSLQGESSFWVKLINSINSTPTVLKAIDDLRTVTSPEQEIMSGPELGISLNSLHQGLSDPGQGGYFLSGVDTLSPGINFSYALPWQGQVSSQVAWNNLVGLDNQGVFFSLAPKFTLQYSQEFPIPRPEDPGDGQIRLAELSLIKILNAESLESIKSYLQVAMHNQKLIHIENQLIELEEKQQQIAQSATGLLTRAGTPDYRLAILRKRQEFRRTQGDYEDLLEEVFGFDNGGQEISWGRFFPVIIRLAERAEFHLKQISETRTPWVLFNEYQSILLLEPRISEITPQGPKVDFQFDIEPTTDATRPRNLNTAIESAGGVPSNWRVSLDISIPLMKDHRQEKINTREFQEKYTQWIREREVAQVQAAQTLVEYQRSVERLIQEGEFLRQEVKLLETLIEELGQGTSREFSLYDQELYNPGREYEDRLEEIQGRLPELQYEIGLLQLQTAGGFGFDIFQNLVEVIGAKE